MTERGARLDGERRLLGVGDVLRAIEDQFHTAFPRRIWVCGTLRGLRPGEPDQLSGDGRVLVRPSGTEPVVRVLAEAPTASEAEKLCDTIAALVRRELG